MHFRYPLATSSWGKEELAALNEVIESDRFTMGERVAQFEKAFAYLQNNKNDYGQQYERQGFRKDFDPDLTKNYKTRTDYKYNTI